MLYRLYEYSSTILYKKKKILNNFILNFKMSEINLLRGINLISLGIKGFLFFAVKYNGFEENIKSQPFFMTKFHNYERIDEAHYLIEKGYEPYIVDHIF